jgi:prepilin-type N-terminal cleavage/methylation domain-containing protein
MMPRNPLDTATRRHGDTEKTQTLPVPIFSRFPDSPRPRVAVSPCPRVSAARGFTLLEVLLAVSIFAIVTSALYTTFRTGMRAYRVGAQTGQTMQTGRFAMDILVRDLKNVFSLTETIYNRQYRLRREKLQEAIRQAQLDVDKSIDLADAVDQFNHTPPGIDLSISGSGTEESADVTFVRRQERYAHRPDKPMQLARVRFYRQADRLMRSEQDIFLPEVDIDGTYMPPVEPRSETLLHGLKEFGIEYGFYYDGAWMETRKWSSDSRDHKTDRLSIWQVPGTGRKLNQFVESYEEGIPQDNVPSYVRVRLVIADPRGQARARVFERTINLATGMATHVPFFEEITIEDDEGEEHHFSRRDLTVAPDGRLRSRRLGIQGQNERPRHGNFAEFYLP